MQTFYIVFIKEMLGFQMLAVTVLKVRHSWDLFHSIISFNAHFKALMLNKNGYHK